MDTQNFQKNLLVYLIRGLPGAGKSTLAQQLCYWHQSKNLRSLHLEADQFFVQPNGEYKFDRALLDKAHEWCQATFTEAVNQQVDVIVVSNTFTMKWEMEFYEAEACLNGYNVVRIIVDSDFKSIHDVPEKTLRKMRERFQY